MNHGKCKCSQSFILAMHTSVFSADSVSFLLDMVQLQSWAQWLLYQVRLCVPRDAVRMRGTSHIQWMFEWVPLGLLLSLCLLWNLTSRSCLWLSPVSLRPVALLYRGALLVEDCRGKTVYPLSPHPDLRSCRWTPVTWNLCWLFTWLAIERIYELVKQKFPSLKTATDLCCAWTRQLKTLSTCVQGGACHAVLDCSLMVFNALLFFIICF